MTAVFDLHAERILPTARWGGIVLTALVVGAPFEIARASSPVTSTFHEIEVVRGLEQLAAGDSERALAAFEPLALSSRADGMADRARLLAARAALALPDGARALRHLDALSAPFDEIADHLLELRARAHRAEGNWPAAQKFWEKLLALAPDSQTADRARFGIADAYLAQGDTRRADAAYRSAIAATHRDDEAAFIARFSLAEMLRGQGKARESATLYRWIAYRAPHDPLAQLAAARLEELVARGATAAPTLGEKLERIDRLLSARSVELARSGLEALAHEAMSDDDRRQLDERRAELAYRSEDFTTAVQLLQTLSQQNPSRRTGYLQEIARCLSAAHRTDEAVDAYLEVAKRLGRGKKGRDAYFKAAWLAYNGGAHQRAVELFGTFIREFPSDRAAIADATWYLAWNAFRMRDLALARTTLEQLRNDFPDSPLAQRSWYWEGRIAALVGEPEQARTAFDEAHRLNPFDYYAALSRQRLEELASNGQLPSRPVASLEVEVSSETGSDVLGLDVSTAIGAPTVDNLSSPEGSDLPWGETALDWQTAAGRRVLTLMSLGLHDEAAQSAAELPARTGFARQEINYARARLLYALGDFNAAYRLVDMTFGEQLRAAPNNDTTPLLQLAYPEAYRRLVRDAAREFGVSSWLILAIMRQESAFDDRARSLASANGLMQIIPRTGEKIAAALGVHDYDFGVLRDPAVNVRFGAWYLGQLVEKFHGHLALAIASYNAGPVVLERWLTNRGPIASDEFVEDIPFRETRHYVKRVLGNLAAYQALYEGKPLQLPPTIPASARNNVSF